MKEIFLVLGALTCSQRRGGGLEVTLLLPVWAHVEEAEEKKKKKKKSAVDGRVLNLSEFCAQSQPDILTEVPAERVIKK